MRRYLLPLLFTLFLPLLIGGICLVRSKDGQTEPQTDTQRTSFEVCPKEITVLQSETGAVITSDLETCVIAALASYVCADTPPESAKAQAIAARSFLLNLLVSNQKECAAHQNALLCNDGMHCIQLDFSSSPSELISQAVAETQGKYLGYEGTPAQTFSFSVSGGRTESAEELWNLALPYLQSVESELDRTSAQFQSRVFYPMDACITVLSGARHGIAVPLSIGTVERTSAGSVKTIEISGETFSGEEIRELFHLRSAHFELCFRNRQAVFEVYGDGHGVGMSRFGASCMAKQGASYADILAHYYPGTELLSI